MANTAKKILVVDDELKIVEIIKTYLENSGYSVLSAYNGKDALDIFEKNRPNLVILDLMLPDISGEEICMTIRKKSRVPILMLTAKIEEEDILKGLDIGADDYVIKPFSAKQLVARVNALMRRITNEPELLASIISFNDDLSINSLSHEVKKNGELVNLTPNEYKILVTLIKHPHKTFTREELLDLALGEDYSGFDRTIDTHIKNLRQKIETDSKSPKYILTVHGVGYKFGGN